MSLLGRREVLDGDLADRMRRAVGFRNVLVHEYVDIDDSVVLARLHDLADLRDFARAVVNWIDGSQAAAKSRR